MYADYYLEFSCALSSEGQEEILSARLMDLDFLGCASERESFRAFAQKECWDQSLEAVSEIFRSLGLDWSCACVLPENWNAKWEEGFDPIVVDGHCVIRASFHPSSETDLPEIVIDPKMSFGTGHHETTYMMISQMSRLDFEQKSVLDYGSGTAVLAIRAEQLGAMEIDAIDYDPHCTESAKENIDVNACSNIHVHEGELALLEGKSYDIILANINRHVILDNLERLNGMLRSGGQILFSGLLQSDYGLMAENFRAQGWKIDVVDHRGEWICVLVRSTNERTKERLID